MNVILFPLFCGRELTRLNVGKNLIERVPKAALVPLKYLQHLDFTDNNIVNIEAGDFEGEFLLCHGNHSHEPERERERETNHGIHFVLFLRPVAGVIRVGERGRVPCGDPIKVEEDH